MRKFLTTGLFSAILGIAVGAPADAALVSRGFLDEALENYATTTALDLKADNADLTNLSNIVGELPDGLTVSQMLTSFWTTNGTTYPGLGFISDYIHRIELAYNTRFPYIFLDGGPSTTIDGVDYTGPVYPLWKLSEGIDKIGTLPTAMELYEYDANGTLGRTKYPTADVFGINDNIGGMLTAILRGFGDSSGHIVLSLPEISTRTVRLSDQIGTLPSGNFPIFPEYENLFSWLNQPLTYPTSLAELITAIYGNSETGGPGLLAAIIAGFQIDTDGDGSPDKIVGLIPNFWLARDANNLATENATKIGTVPDGKNLAGMISETDAKIGELPTEIPNMDSTWTKYGFVEDPGTPIDLPDTIGGMFAMLFNEDSSYNGLSLRNIMVKILMGFDAIGSRIEGLANLTSAYKLVGDSPIVTAVKANTAKIGDLPTEYETVGAALTAIKGIAEDAKAAALSAIPDPKAEGSTGKFVLTVDIVGDNATYRWEKIDREGEATTTE